jgi:hypothetical protein
MLIGRLSPLKTSPRDESVRCVRRQITPTQQFGLWLEGLLDGHRKVRICFGNVTLDAGHQIRAIRPALLEMLFSGMGRCELLQQLLMVGLQPCRRILDSGLPDELEVFTAELRTPVEVVFSYEVLDVGMKNLAALKTPNVIAIRPCLVEELRDMVVKLLFRHI